MLRIPSSGQPPANRHSTPDQHRQTSNTTIPYAQQILLTLTGPNRSIFCPGLRTGAGVLSRIWSRRGSFIWGHGLGCDADGCHSPTNDFQ
jgi:hypothetical protein